MAAALRISQAYRMTASSSSPVVLFSPERAYGAVLRQWGEPEAKRVALAVVWGRYTEEAAHEELATHLACHAQRAGIASVSCRNLASSMLDDELTALDHHHHTVLQDMIAAAEASLEADRRSSLKAATAAADIARRANVPPYLIDTAFRIALWRTRRRA